MFRSSSPLSALDSQHSLCRHLPLVSLLSIPQSCEPPPPRSIAASSSTAQAHSTQHTAGSTSAMDQLKETKTDKQQAPASTSASSNSASCSSSSSAASSPSEAQHDQDGLNDISLSTTHPLSTDPLANDNTATAPPTDVLSMETRAEEDTTADGAAMDIDQQQSAESHTTAVNGADSGSTGASTDPARMTDDLASSLSSASLTSLSVSSSSTASPDTAAPSTSTVTAPSANTPAAADTTPAAAASASSSSADTATTTPADSELATFSLDVDEQRIQDCLRLMHTDIKRGEASVRAILKMLQNLQKAPTKPDNRRMRKDVSCQAKLPHTTHAVHCIKGTASC